MTARLSRSRLFARRPGGLWLDLSLAGLGLLFSSVALGYPFGWDQGVNYYVAREWLLRGALPYRDSFDHRMPGIYVLHAACLALFGEHMWGIRVAEILCVVALGLACAYAATARGQRPPPGVRGAAVFAACTLYWGFFDFWNTAQCELWATAMVMVAVAIVLRSRGDRLAAIASGLLGGLAMLLKPTVLPIFLVGVGPWLLLRQGDRRRAKLGRVGMFSAAFLVPIATTFSYFTAKGGLQSLLDVLVRVNWHYMEEEPRTLPLGTLAGKLGDAWRFFAPLSSMLLAVLVVALLVTWLRGQRGFGRYARCAALCAAAALSVVAQRKLYLYHWTVMVGPLTLFVACLTGDLLPIARRLRAPWAAPALGSTLLLAVIATTGTPYEAWLGATGATLRWLAGDIDDETFAFAFCEVKYGYRYDDRYRVGTWLREHARPGDRVLVRGVAAEIYAISGLRASSRFFWTPFLTMPTRHYDERSEWLREDREEFERDPPRFAVAYKHWKAGPDSPSWFEPYGYVLRHKVDGFYIMERSPSVATTP